MTYNKWHVDKTPDGDEFTATFEPRDFESWFLEGESRDTPFTPSNEVELYENCLYLAQSEARRITQSARELRHAIKAWAADWNARIREATDA